MGLSEPLTRADAAALVRRYMADIDGKLNAEYEAVVTRHDAQFKSDQSLSERDKSMEWSRAYQTFLLRTAPMRAERDYLIGKLAEVELVVLPISSAI